MVVRPDGDLRGRGARHAGDHAGKTFLISQHGVAVLNLAGQDRQAAGTAHPGLAGRLDRNAVAAQGIEKREVCGRDVCVS